MDVRELEAQFDQIDEQSESGAVNVSVERGTESSGNLKVSVTKKERRSDPTTETADVADSKSLQTSTLLDLNLAEVDVPDEYIDERVRAAFSNTNESPELPGALLRQVGATKDWELMENYSYPTRLGGPTEFTITALKGFIFDRASVPAIVWVITKDSLGSVPPLFHDLLYRNGGVLPESEAPPLTKYGQVTPTRIFSRKETDELFREVALKSGVKKWRAEAAYLAVRTGGGFAWQD